MICARPGEPAGPRVGVIHSGSSAQFFDPEKFSFKAKRGLSEEVVKEISWMKQEPEWMTKLRLRSLGIFRKKPMPTWGADLYGMTEGASGAATAQPALPQDPHVAVLGDLPL